MFLVEQSKHNNLAKFAFYKNFFDRFTADMAFITSMSQMQRDQIIIDSIKSRNIKNSIHP